LGRTYLKNFYEKVARAKEWKGKQEGCFFKGQIILIWPFFEAVCKKGNELAIWPFFGLFEC